jgi:hypothetical protein
MTVRQLATANRLRVLLVFQSVFRQELLRLAVLGASQRFGSAALPNIPWKGPHSTHSGSNRRFRKMFCFGDTRMKKAAGPDPIPQAADDCWLVPMTGG